MSFDPDHDPIAALMKDYAAPVTDDGFSQAVLSRINRLAALRRWALAGACLFAGLLVAALLKYFSVIELTQFASTDWSVVENLRAYLPPMDSFEMPLGLPFWTLGLPILLAGFLLYEAVDA